MLDFMSKPETSCPKNRKDGKDIAGWDAFEGNQRSIALCHPHIPKNALKYIEDTLSTRWIGQGPKVERFEKEFSRKFCDGGNAVAVGSGTDALHLAYLLADIKSGDEVIVPVFTCTATNLPLLYIGAKVVFADIERDTLNISCDHVKSLVNKRTKAIVCVHYGGLPCDMDALHDIARQWDIPVIEDAAHALGASYKGKPIGAVSDFTMFSFQAIKHITTGDGGMLSIKDNDLRKKAERLRWFGIDRAAKAAGHWDNEITEVGFKYQMNDVMASMGIAALEEFDDIIRHRQNLFLLYKQKLANIAGLRFIGGDYTDRGHAAWLCTVDVEKRTDLERKLRENLIESSQIHYRNDRYSVFGGRRDNLPNMEAMENNYLVLPLHTKLHDEDINRVCDVIKSGW
jgi:dTDP-4-amino-4,6-dideoxygalactose transaminase